MKRNRSQPRRYPRFDWLDLGLGLAAAACLVVLVNYLASRHPVRTSITSDPQLELSPLTQEWVSQITHPVRIVVFHNPEDPSPQHSLTMSLLREYRFLNDRLSVEVVDLLRQPSKAQMIRKEYQLEADEEREGILFAAHGRHRVIQPTELVQYDMGQADATGHIPVRMVGFHGERVFTSTLMHLIESTPPMAYYLTGHGEHDLASRDLEGYYDFRSLLAERNVRLLPLSLRDTPSIPEDASFLIIAGPTQAYADSELTLLSAYLRQGGRILMGFHVQSFGRDTGLEAWLKDWGIRVGHNVVRDQTRTAGQLLLVDQLAPHPSTDPLIERGSALTMVLPRSVQPHQTAPKEDLSLSIMPIAMTSTNGMTQSTFRYGTYVHEPLRDIRGRIPLITVMEGTFEGASAALPPCRLVVLGDASLWNNTNLSRQGNRDYAWLTASWLLDRYQSQGSIGPKPLRRFRIDVPKREFQRFQWTLLAGLPLGVFALGFGVWLMRRH